MTRTSVFTIALAALVPLITLACGSDPPSRSQDDDDDDGSGGASVTSSGGGEAPNGGVTTSSTTSAGGDDSDPPPPPPDTVEQLCVDLINQHRASIGLPPFARWTEAEACSSEEAKSDSETGTAHGAFGQCQESAQNECPGWPGKPEEMIGNCLQMMWDEGPGEDFQKHGHYINMSSQSYTKVACGFFVTPEGNVWSVQNFK